MLISFLGALPPGHMTIAASLIAAQQGTVPAFIYGLGSMLAEIIVVRLALIVMDHIARQYKIFLLLEIITAALLLVMTAGCFYLAARITGITGTNIFSFDEPFSTGFLISIINPIHIPFWLGWSVVLFNKNILQPNPGQYNWYVAGIGAGSMFGFAVFIYGGEWLLHTFGQNQDYILIVAGFALLVASYLHIRKMMLLPASIRYSAIFKNRNEQL
jgi:threonine/homoserine/homoserine lactone efflux protein